MHNKHLSCEKRATDYHQENQGQNQGKQPTNILGLGNEPWISKPVLAYPSSHVLKFAAATQQTSTPNASPEFTGTVAKWQYLIYFTSHQISAQGKKRKYHKHDE